MREPTYNKNNHDDTMSRRTKSLVTTRIQSSSRANIALQLTGTALHLSLVKSLARLHQRSKAAPAAERNVGRTKYQLLGCLPSLCPPFMRYTPVPLRATGSPGATDTEADNQC